jgi:hypothetical protein
MVGIIQTNINLLRHTLRGVQKDIDRIKEQRAKEEEPLPPAIAVQKHRLAETGQLESPAETMITAFPANLKERMAQYKQEAREAKIEGSLAVWARRGAAATGTPEQQEFVQELREEQLQEQQAEFLQQQQYLTEMFALRTDPIAPITAVTVPSSSLDFGIQLPQFGLPEIDLLKGFGDIGKWALIAGAGLLGILLLTRR